MEKLENGYLVLSRIMDKDKLKGFLLAHTSGSVERVSLDAIKTVGYNINYINASYDEQYGTLVGINGESLAKYPTINEDFVLTSKGGIIVLATILDMNTKKPIGVVAYNGTGRVFNLSYKSLEELSRKNNCCNFDIINDKFYGLIAVKKNGKYFGTVEMSIPDTTATKEKKEKSIIQQLDNTEIPVIQVYSMDFVKSSEFNQPCQDKLVRTMINMQALTPYYYTILQAIRRLPAPGLGTLGVTQDTLYYDMKFVAELGVPELTFVLIHEIMHIAMQHSARFGTRTNHDLWNIATDLYINSIICHDFGIKFGSPSVNVGNSLKPIEIKTPNFGVYMETIGETIDLSCDTPESIYNKLLKENPNYGMSGGSSSSQSQQGNQGGQSQSQSIQQGIKNIQNGANKAQQQINQNGNTQQRQQAQQANQQVQQGCQQMQQGLQNNNQQQVQQGLQQAMQGCKQLGSIMNQIAQQQMQQGSQQLQQGANNAQQSCGNSPNSQQANQQIQQGIQQTQQGMQNSNSNQVQQGLNQIQQGIQNMQNALQQAGQQGTQQGQQSSNSMNQGMSQMQNATSQGQFGKSGQGQGQGQSGMTSASNQMKTGLSQAQSGLNGNENNQQGKLGESIDSGDIGGDLASGGDDDSAGKFKEVSVIYNGKKLTGIVMKDVMSNRDTKSENNEKANLEDSRRALQKITTKIKMEEEALGESLTKNVSEGGGLVQRYIEFGLSSGVDWRVLVKNMCKDKPKKTFTLANPNVDYMNMGMTLADRRAIGKPTHISHVKFAVDVSGSVSQKELQVILSEINNIFTHFKVDGELIYWSTNIGDVGMFSSLKDMLKVKPKSTGGTDVRCVFEYLNGEIEVGGKYESDKVRDIKGVFIITDGYFNMNFKDYETAFGRRVVWLITGTKGNPIIFNPPFGKVIGLDIDN